METLSDNLNDWPSLSPAYSQIFDELSKDKYEVRSTYEHYCIQEGIPHKDKPTVVLRIDVDAGFHLSYPLALHLHRRGLTASHYFLTNEKRYYNLWKSKIPQKITALGQEVGLHSDHLYEQIVYKSDGLKQIENDVKRLKDLVDGKVYGMVYHGHPDMNSLKLCNAMLYEKVHPEEFGLAYHDGLSSCYRDPLKGIGYPKCDERLIDYMGFPNSWGWNYLKNYPLSFIKQNAKKGKVFCIDFHTHNAFEYWYNWPEWYNEQKLSKESFLTFKKKQFKIFVSLYIQPFLFKTLKYLGIYKLARNFLKK